MAEDRKPSRRELMYDKTSASDDKRGGKPAKPEAKGAPEPAGGGDDVRDRHAREREDMHKQHRTERRDLHGQHRQAHDDMHARHERQMADMEARQDSEVAAMGQSPAGAAPQGAMQPGVPTQPAPGAA